MPLRPRKVLRDLILEYGKLAPNASEAPPAAGSPAPATASGGEQGRVALRVMVEVTAARETADLELPFLFVCLFVF
jgi:hypothetical protein